MAYLLDIEKAVRKFEARQKSASPEEKRMFLVEAGVLKKSGGLTKTLRPDAEQLKASKTSKPRKKAVR